jgi:group I intron endonuclease
MRQKTYNSNCALLALVNSNQKELLHKSGIYKLSFPETDNFYIGSTTESFKRRYLRHFRALKENSHYNSILQKAFRKYNEKMTLEILEVCLPEECISREQFYIDKLNPVYNICKTAGNTLGVKPSEKSLLATSKKVDMFDLEGNFVRTFKSRKEAFRETGICDSCVSQAIRNKGVASGFQFRNHGEHTSLTPYENPLSQKILQYSLDGNFIKEYSSMLEASNELNIPTGNISKHLKDLTNKCYDFIFKKYEENYLMKIKGYVQHHKFQQQVIIEDLQTGEIKKFSSTRSIDKKIITRSSLRLYKSKGLTDFVVKKRYRIQIKAHDPNEVMEI